jgi:hypothetical protein
MREYLHYFWVNKNLSTYMSLLKAISSCLDTGWFTKQMLCAACDKINLFSIFSLKLAIVASEAAINFSLCAFHTRNIQKIYSIYLRHASETNTGKWYNIDRDGKQV